MSKPPDSINRRRVLAGAAGAALLSIAPPAWADEPVIAAASDLKFALDEIVGLFLRETGRRVKLAYGSSGNFAMQIRNGAPFQLFLSADEAYIHQLHKEGYARDEGLLYATGRIVLFAAHASPVKVDEEWKGLKTFVRDRRLRRFAIANPDHAPYGQRAVEALKTAGLWDAVKSRLVLGENISQAAQFAATGSAQAGIIALSLAKAPQIGALGRYALIPESWHAPLHQRMALMKQAGPTAQAFYAFLQQADARATLDRYGFTLPDGR